VTAAIATLDQVFLSRLQFGFVISFHIIFPAFTIGLAAWLATIEGMRLATGSPIYRRAFDFWLKVFAMSFGMGVVTGVVMAFQFGTNWGVLSEWMGAIQGRFLATRPTIGCRSRWAILYSTARSSPRIGGRLPPPLSRRVLLQPTYPSRAQGNDCQFSLQLLSFRHR
jgi:hypothetical protein